MGRGDGGRDAQPHEKRHEAHTRSNRRPPSDGKAHRQRRGRRRGAKEVRADRTRHENRRRLAERTGSEQRHEHRKAGQREGAGPRTSILPIAITAAATTAAAANSSPCTHPASVRSTSRAQIASAVMITAEGRVNPTQAARPPSFPARSTPIAIPSWLDDGPGNRLVSATSSPNCFSSSQRRRET